jgi:hypothetical protein
MFRGDRFFVVQYSPAVGFGVSGIQKNELPFGGHDEVFDNVQDVVLCLEKLFG